HYIYVEGGGLGQGAGARHDAGPVRRRRAMGDDRADCLFRRPQPGEGGAHPRAEVRRLAPRSRPDTLRPILSRSRTSMDIFDAVASRYSCRAFLPTPVPETTVRDIVARASRAPSAGNMQPWRVYAIAGERVEALKTQLAP